MMLNTIRSSATARLCGLLAAGLLLSGAPSPAKARRRRRGAGRAAGQAAQHARRSAPLLRKHRLTLMSQLRRASDLPAEGRWAAHVHDKIAALRTELDVLIAEPNFVHQSPEARRRNVSWAIGTAGDLRDPVGARRRCACARPSRLSIGAGIRVAVLDTGVDRRHPALAGRLLRGFDFVDFDTDPVGTGQPGRTRASATARMSPAWWRWRRRGARIMPLRVLDTDGQGNAWVLAEAMLYAVDPDGNPATDDGAQVINLSLGSTSRTHLLDTVAKLSACAIAAPVVDPADDLRDPGYNGDKARCASFGGAVVVARGRQRRQPAVRQYPAAEGSLRPAGRGGQQRRRDARELQQLRRRGSTSRRPARASPAPCPAACTAPGAAPRWRRRWRPARQRWCARCTPAWPRRMSRGA